MRPDASKILEKQIKYHLERTQNPSILRMYNDSLIEIDTVLKKTARINKTRFSIFEKMNSIANDLGFANLFKTRDFPFIHAEILLSVLASWHASSGVVELAKGKIAGWEQIHRSSLYELWTMRSHIARSQDKLMMKPCSGEALQKHYNFYVLANECTLALCLCFAWYHSLDDFAVQIGDHVVEALSVSSLEYRSSLLIFVSWMHSQMRQSPRDYSERHLGRYYPLVSQWNNPEPLDEVYWKVCEYHCRRIYDSRSDPTYFCIGAFDVVPYEILFSLMLRQKQGLPIPARTHPLLLSVFADPPQSIPSDALIERFSDSYFHRYS